MSRTPHPCRYAPQALPIPIDEPKAKQKELKAKSKTSDKEICVYLPFGICNRQLQRLEARGLSALKPGSCLAPILPIV
jgi:hypothetical protein